MMTEVGIAACPRPMVVEGYGLHHRRLPILRIPIFVGPGSTTRRHHEERKKRGYNSCPKLHSEPPYLQYGGGNHRLPKLNNRLCSSPLSATVFTSIIFLGRRSSVADDLYGVVAAFPLASVVPVEGELNRRVVGCADIDINIIKSNRRRVGRGVFCVLPIVV